MFLRVYGVSYTFDEAWEKLLSVAPKFANSHYYDIMSYGCGLMGFLILLLFRPAIKNLHRKIILKKYGVDLRLNENESLKPRMIYRIMNLIIPALAGVISMCGYAYIAYFSDRIRIGSYWFEACALFPTAIYTIYEFCSSGILGFIFVIAVCLIISKFNYTYCLEFEDHHKACYAVRYSMVTFGIIGIVKQFAPPFKFVVGMIKKKFKKEK